MTANFIDEAGPATSDVPDDNDVPDRRSGSVLARLLERFGTASGLTVVWAKVGQELLNLARALDPDIIVVNPELPGTVRGWEAVRAIRAELGLAHIPVLTCSWLSEADALALTGGRGRPSAGTRLHYEALSLRWQTPA